ncbi:hypothetical protein BU17DRAFT_44466 [Hysterangium stoloniferum]|nr:hypothetical protein BU17DRAFT_44466 [Hysterangium stoloniferum]
MEQERAIEDEEVAAVEAVANGRTLKADSKSRSASVQAPPPQTDTVIDSHPSQAEASTSTVLPPTYPKPKSTKQRKSRSPSPVPIPQAPPLRTVRLDITLGGPDHYEIDVSGLALETGQRNPTPPPVKRDTSDSDDDSENEGQGQAKPKPKAKSKRARNADYDLADPFIDDSELAIDDRTHFAQTKQQGFYVSSGEVALLKDKSPKRPRSKHPLVLTSAAAASIKPLSHTAPASISNPTRPPSRLSPASGQDGTRDSPIALLDDEDKPSTLKRKEHSTPPSTAGGDGSKKRRKVQLKAFSDELEASIEALKVAIAQESFEVKGKFPPPLKPKLQQLALQAIVQGEYNDNFFARMPQLFPYNKFTMTKLIKRLVYHDHHMLLVARQDVLLEELKALADGGFEQAQAEWERNVLNWRRHDADLATTKGSSASAEPSANGDENDVRMPPPSRSHHPSGDGTPKDPKAAKKLEDLHEKEPPKKYRLTDPMKDIFWELYCLSNECSRLTNEKNQLEGSPDSVSEQGMRKGLYQKIISAFPDGWMTSGNISRDISVIKKKHESEQSRYDEYS